ncbi:Hypothetical protein OINT_2000907 [Brucella intermedia LMG 3301]|uniref:Uncharacterized protein n=1 Tax=Brucella intermedia LMG 3301 TaxID=641118 RepID=C4WM36_9HYPH|nr:Hypothetical protein OINT_2000907 [Brucella intermedia LMG 3301]
MTTLSLWDAKVSPRQAVTHRIGPNPIGVSICSKDKTGEIQSNKPWVALPA